MDFGMKIFLVIRTLDQRMFIYTWDTKWPKVCKSAHFSSVITDDLRAHGAKICPSPPTPCRRHCHQKPYFTPYYQRPERATHSKICPNTMTTGCHRQYLHHSIENLETQHVSVVCEIDTVYRIYRKSLKVVGQPKTWFVKLRRKKNTFKMEKGKVQMVTECDLTNSCHRSWQLRWTAPTGRKPLVHYSG